ncbi:MAG: acyltransferase family protein [Candidatus Eiseniibacteriota bacterium]
MTTTNQRRKIEIKSNTAFRGIGAIIVMLYHFVSYRQHDGNVAYAFVLGDNMSVTLDMFFVLSGYIMAYIYTDWFAAGLPRDKTINFYWHRFIRCYPMHIFALLLFLAMRAAYIALASHDVSGFSGADPRAFFYSDGENANTPYTLFLNVVLLQAWGFSSLLSWNYPSWALSAEFAAYFAFPLMCLLIGRLGRNAAFVLIAFSLGVYLVLDQVYGTLNVDGNIGALRSVPGFAIGVATFLLSGYVGRLSLTRLNVLQTVVVALTLAAFYFADHKVIVVAAVALLVSITSVNSGWVPALLDNKPLQYLGTISYTIYIMHVVVGIPTKQVLNVARDAIGIPETVSWWPMTVLLAQMGATVIVCAVLYKLIEVPARHYLEGLVRARRAARAAAASGAAAVPTAGAVPVAAESQQRGGVGA